MQDYKVDIGFLIFDNSLLDTINWICNVFIHYSVSNVVLAPHPSFLQNKVKKKKKSIRTILGDRILFYHTQLNIQKMQLNLITL